MALRVEACSSSYVAQLLLLIACSITTTDGIGTTVCPPDGGAAGPSLSPPYQTVDGTGHAYYYPQAAVLFDPIYVVGCCGFVTGFTLVVNGDSVYGGCESMYGGCPIDFIIWKNPDTTYDPVKGYGAYVHGIINNYTVYTDASWTNGGQSVPYTVNLQQSDWIALDPGVNYYPGWNTEQVMAIDFIENTTSNECATIANIQCIPANNYATTEYLKNYKGFTQGSLTSGEYCQYFDVGITARFYAFQVIVESGTPPSFVSQGTTMYVRSTVGAGVNIVTATANNPETSETLTYSKASETPTTASCFNVDSTTGAITSAVALASCMGPHNVSVSVSDGCMFAKTTYTFIVWTTTTTESATTTGPAVTTNGGTGTSTTTTTAATTTTVTTTTTAPTTTPGLFDTTTGKIIIGIIVGLALLVVGAFIGLCVVLSKNAAAGSVNQVTSATPGQTTNPTATSNEIKQSPPADDDYSHMLKMKSKQRYLESEKKAWDWA